MPVIRGALSMTGLGLAFNFFLWTIPALVAAAALPHSIFGESAPSLSQALAQLERNAGPTPSLADALVQLIGAESEALQVAGAALQPTRPADLASQADYAGNRVKSAVTVYVGAVQNTLDHTPKR
jgi:hypothetical protein